jgi:hypothetical protein
MLKLQLSELPEFTTHEPDETGLPPPPSWSEGMYPQDCVGLSLLCHVQGLKCTKPFGGYVYFINCLTSNFCMMANLT